MRSFYYRHRTSTWLIIIFITILFILSSVKRNSKSKSTHNSTKKDRGLFRFDSNTRHIQVRNLKGDLILEGELGVKIDGSYSVPEENTKGGLHYTWGDHITLSITKGVKNCLLVDWDNISEESFTPMDCFSLGKSLWYGGGQLNIPSWPVNRASVSMAPFYSRPNSGATTERQHFTSVIEPYWLSSSGVAIYVDEFVPLHVSLNANGDRKLCLKADTREYPWHQEPVHLKYRLCFGNNVKSTHRFMASRFFNRPTESLSKSIMRYPVCTVKSPNQGNVMRFFRSVVIRQFACGHINLGYQHGLEFNRRDFANPKSLINEIQSKKMNVMAVIDSSFSTKSGVYKDAPDEYLVQSAEGYTINLANTKVKNWFVERVRDFKERYSIDTLRFCCGDVKFPVEYYTLGKDQNPSVVMRNYANVAASAGQSSDIHVGYRTQSLPLVVQIAERKPEWSRDLGLRSLIPMVLSVSVLGYPFVTIGPIGGSYDVRKKIDKELYIRWMQLSVFFPVMEFVSYPWDFDQDTVHVSAEILDIRSMLWDSILTIMKQSVDTGAPIIRPMWWISPNDPATYGLSSQFMLGDIYLVAPILWPGKKTHDVYLPKGVWREMFGKGVKHEIDAGQWITFAVDLKTVVYFECLLCED